MSDVLERAAREPDDVVAYGAHPLHLIEVYGADADSPVVVLVHGGFWRARYDRTHLRPMAEALADRGMTVLLPEYRRVGDEGGGWPAALHDVRAAIDWAADSGRGPAVVAGHSAGGHLAVRAFVRGPSSSAGPWWGRRTPPPVLVSLAGVLDLSEAHRAAYSDDAVGELLRSNEPGFAARLWDADPLGLPTPAGVVRLVHGTADEDVPVGQSRAYAAAHRGVELTEVEGGGHFDLIDPEAAAFEAVLAALEPVRNS